jgi:hypothetical protein
LSRELTQITRIKTGVIMIRAKTGVFWRKFIAAMVTSLGEKTNILKNTE